MSSDTGASHPQMCQLCSCSTKKMSKGQLDLDWIHPPKTNSQIPKLMVWKGRGLLFSMDMLGMLNFWGVTYGNHILIETIATG